MNKKDFKIRDMYKISNNNKYIDKKISQKKLVKTVKNRSLLGTEFVDILKMRFLFTRKPVHFRFRCFQGN